MLKSPLTSGNSSTRISYILDVMAVPFLATTGAVDLRMAIVSGVRVVTGISEVDGQTGLVLFSQLQAPT